MTENANEITKNAVNENGSSAPKEKETDNRKVAIIGCGFVGASDRKSTRLNSSHIH